VAALPRRAREGVRARAALASARGEGDFDAALEACVRVDPSIGPENARARAIVVGAVDSAPFAAGGGPGLRAQASVVLDAAAALRDGALPRASHALRALAERAERGERPAPGAFTVAQAGLSSESAEIRGAAGRLASALLAGASASPPRGWVPLALALTAAGMDELATAARRAGASAGEPGAADALVLSLTRSAWLLAASGERSRALAKLREAKAFARGGTPAGAAARAGPPPRAPSPVPSRST
jgi:hypothetical protein